MPGCGAFDAASAFLFFFFALSYALSFVSRGKGLKKKGKGHKFGL
jgi:hypothetical protein